MEYLTSGITANFDMYFHPRRVAQASADCGFRTVFCGSVNSYGGSVEQEEEDYAYLNGFHELISARFGFHAEYTCERPLLEKIAESAQRRKIPVYCHNSEGRPEVEQCLERTKMTPTAYLDSIGLFEYGGGGFHCVHLSDEDMEIFKRRGMYAITCPASNLKLASGIAPLKILGDRGIPVAIGTDGPASNNCLDFFREMFLVAGLQKVREDDASVMDAGGVLRMATTTGALAMGLNNCDTLAVGKAADIVVLDLQQPNMQPQNNIIKNVVYAGSKSNVKLTMVNGKILYEDGKFDIGVEPKELYERANGIIGRMR
jgi:5-methylthioadenosine/S-adenosylhomocysteine deaminase